MLVEQPAQKRCAQEVDTASSAGLNPDQHELQNSSDIGWVGVPLELSLINLEEDRWLVRAARSRTQGQTHARLLVILVVY